MSSREGSKQRVKSETPTGLDLAHILKDEATLRQWLLDAAIDPTSAVNPPLARSNAKKTSHRHGWVYVFLNRKVRTLNHYLSMLNNAAKIAASDGSERPQCRSSYGSTSSRHSERTVDSGYHSISGDGNSATIAELFKVMEHKAEDETTALTNDSLTELQSASKGPMARYERIQLWKRLETEGNLNLEIKDTLADMPQFHSVNLRTIRRRESDFLPRFSGTHLSPALSLGDQEPMASPRRASIDATDPLSPFYSQEAPWGRANSAMGSHGVRRTKRPTPLMLDSPVDDDLGPPPLLPPPLRTKGSDSSWTDMSDLGSASMREDRVLDPFRATLSRLLMSRYQDYRTHQTGAGSSSGSPSQRASSSPIQSNASDTSQGKRGDKRKQIRDPSDGNDEPLTTRRRVNNPAEDTTEKLLACPFCKNNPRRYRDCYKYVLRDISRLK